MSVKLDMLLNPGTVTDSTECGVANGISAGGFSDGSHGDSYEVVTLVSGSGDGTTGPE